MENKNDSMVEINDEDTKEQDFTPEELEADTTDWKAKALELKGIAKRRATQLAKAKEKLASVKPETKAEPQNKSVENKKSDEMLLEKLEKVTLRSEGITHPDDVEFARNIAKKWGMDVDEVVADEDFKIKLERQQTARANVTATAGVKGDKGSSEVKNTSEYWIAKGVPPTPDQVPDKATRIKIVQAMIAGAKTGGKKFYND